MILDLFREVKHLVFDVDGVFTDGTLLITEDGEFLRRMNVKDGYALKFALRQGLSISIITGGTSMGVKKRFGYLGLDEVHIGVHDKMSVLNDISQRKGFSLSETLYMGDDLPDLECMKAVALSCCPEDASPEIIGVSKYISPKRGGQGCVRDVLEKVMQTQDLWTF